MDDFMNRIDRCIRIIWHTMRRMIAEKDKQYMTERIEISICFIFAYFGKNKLVDTNYNCLLEFHLMKNIEKKIKIMILKAVMKR